MKEEFRHAGIDDVEYIYQLIIEGARDGHYAAWLTGSEQAGALKIMLKDAVENAAITRMSERGVERVQTVTVVYLNNRGERVGFLLASEKVPGSGSTDIELYKCSIAKQHRRNGYARRLIDNFTSGYPGKVKFHARCYKKSSFMISLLKSMGFEQTGVTNEETVSLEKA